MVTAKNEVETVIRVNHPDSKIHASGNTVTIGYLTVKIHHLNSDNTVTLPVQYEVINCAYNY